ncbi:MAG: type II toxin-antitoxin system Phd/YefM family antitoxin [Deltaproteobacteria bacterium]|nr:type II toxin-antitoxin system Phd/YefM family antitoxin [Nannocystaceae bacterium]
MSTRRWSIAAAKAGLSRLVVDAAERPQFIERRGSPVAVVLSTAAYESLTENQRSANRWQAVLELSEEIRRDGGVELKLPARRPRSSPFARK